MDSTQPLLAAIMRAVQPRFSGRFRSAPACASTRTTCTEVLHIFIMLLLVSLTFLIFCYNWAGAAGAVLRQVQVSASLRQHAHHLHALHAVLQIVLLVISLQASDSWKEAVAVGETPRNAAQYQQRPTVRGLYTTRWHAYKESQQHRQRADNACLLKTTHLHEYTQSDPPWGAWSPQPCAAPCSSSCF